MFEEYVFREKRLAVNWKPGAPYFVNFGQSFPETNAHVSLYCYTEDVSKAVAKSGTVKKWCPVHFSNELVLDCDTFEAVQAVDQVLSSLDVSYRQYNSGNKGCHFHVDRSCEPSEMLSLKDSLLVKDFLGGVELDTGIYKPMHLIRGIGCMHEKTYRRKTLVKSTDGSSMLSHQHVKITDKHLANFKLQESSDDRCEWKKFQNRMWYHHPVSGRGKRNAALFCLAKDMLKSGLSQQTTLELCEFFNSSFQFAHDEVDVAKAVQSAMSQVGGCQ